MSPFFYRFDCLDLTPGNKTAGFVLEVSTDALLALSLRPTPQDHLKRVLDDARARISRSGVLPLNRLTGACIGFHGRTGCPRFFAVDPVFGGSIGADPETFSKLQRQETLEDLSDSVSYTPHNFDDSKGALATMLLAQTWAEWAHLQFQAYHREFQHSIQAFKAGTLCPPAGELMVLAAK